MKNLIIIGALFVLATSCGNQPEKESHKEMVVAPQTETGYSEETITKIKSGQLDPVCEMEFDTSWTEKTVYNNDTINFCSENCKMAFNVRPEKYLRVAK